MGETLELLAKIAATMAALLAAAKAWAKLNQNSERREDRAALKQVNDGLQRVIDELKAEVSRCKDDLVFTEERRDRYRKDCHDLRNQIQACNLEKHALYRDLDKAHTDMTVLQLQLDAERLARQARDRRDDHPREEA